MPQPLILTLARRRVLATLLDKDGETYGYELAQATDLTSGTVGQILIHLEAEGIVTSRLEDVDPSKAGRPRRRYYRFTDWGRSYAEERLG